MNVVLLKADATTELPAIAKVLQQLRPQYRCDELVAQIQKQQTMGYQIAYVNSGEDILGVAGFVVAQKLAWGKHIYVDDLVTNEAHRSQGVGTLLIDWLKAHGKELGCQQLHLDSGVQKFAAHRFYLSNRFNIASHHFSMTNLND
ncbi:GNAT family N-acetyltransferase [Thalassotalea maritima]|uniref:GNAT family N-acetyltransferase n=1 Tax=Thalassotalea maritima TaxID=3242416 RepID=UPI00352992CC